MIALRRRLETDLPALLEVLSRVQSVRGYPATMPADPAAWLCSERLLESWVALVDGSIAGQVSLASAAGDRAQSVWSSALVCSEDELGVIKRLFVDPGQERKGIGRRLLRRAVAEAHAKALWPVLDVVSSSEGPLVLYRGEGFALVGDLVMCWPGSDGPVKVSCLAGPPPPCRKPPR